jgi:hypothetical protein
LSAGLFINVEYYGIDLVEKPFNRSELAAKLQITERSSKSRMEQIALEIARLNETLRMIVSIAKEEIRKSEELSKKYEEERKKNEEV